MRDETLLISPLHLSTYKGKEEPIAAASSGSFSAAGRNGPKKWPCCRVRTVSPALQPPVDGSVAGRWTRDFSALCQKNVDRQRSRATQHECRKAREVQQVGFNARRPELRAGCRHSLELDRTEPIGQMHGNHGDQENCRHRYAGQRHQCAKKHGQTTNYLDEDCEPSHEMRRRHAKCLQNRRKRI